MSNMRNANAAMSVYSGNGALNERAGALDDGSGKFRQVTIMNSKWTWIVILMVLLGAGSVGADEAEGDDSNEAAEVTIRLMDSSESSLPDAVIAEIPIPDSMPEEAEFGLETANDARSRRETGLSRAEDARENAENMAEEARENRENRGRADDVIPDNVPDRPDRPQPPGG